MSFCKQKCWSAALVLLAALCSLRGAAAQTECSFLNPPDRSLDLPDDGYFDANGDGIDGMRCGPIFVAPTGSDANLGTIDSPMRTIGAAILAARSHTPRRDVYIANGIYEGTVVLAAGVNLYGGYDAEAGWSRSLASRAMLHLGAAAAGDVALLAVNISQPTVVDHLVIEADRDPNGQSPGTTNAAALLRECAAPVTFRDCALRGLDGTDGVDGVSGAAGGDGQGGSGGYEGGGGVGVPGIGGSGGPGGGPRGGIGGVGGPPAAPGGPGVPGGPGLPGMNGAGGTFDAPGEDGFTGQIGSGGGGGGGGGRGGLCVPYTSNSCWGGRGGSGGRGGGGGGGGTGGGPGGTSYGLIIRATLVEVGRSAVSVSNGSRGGDGGIGGPGGIGGAGGPGQFAGLLCGNLDPCSPLGGHGGPGGAGGIGGLGGYGGGGAGGNSIGILRLAGGTSSVDPSTTITTGTPGSGGLSPGNSGVDGIAAQTYDAALDYIPIRPTCTPCCPPSATSARLVVPSGASQISATIELAADAGIEAADSVTIVTPPAHGIASVQGNVVTYSPKSWFAGVDVFEYQACRSCGGCVNGYAAVFVPTATTGVEAPPVSFALGANHPNPFHRATRIPFSLDRQERVTLAVYNVAGRRVSTVVDRELGPGSHSQEWDGRDARGRAVESGIYYLRLVAGNRTLTQKAVLLR